MVFAIETNTPFIFRTKKSPIRHAAQRHQINDDTREAEIVGHADASSTW